MGDVIDNVSNSLLIECKGGESLMHSIVKALADNSVQAAIVLSLPLVLKQLRLWHISYLKHSKKPNNQDIE